MTNDPHQAERERRDDLVLLAALASHGAVLVLDVLTPLGVAVWILHFLSLPLALLQRRVWLPWLLAALAIALSIAGFFLSPLPPGGSVLRSMVNRSLGSAAFLVTAFAFSQVLKQRAQAARQLWLQTTEARLAQAVAGDLGVERIGQLACAVLCERLGAEVAVLYQLERDVLRLAGGHAVDAALPAAVPLGEGLLGQAVRDGRHQALSPAPPGHLPLRSALGRSDPAHLLILPLEAVGRKVGAIEVGLVRSRLDTRGLGELAACCSESVGVALRGAIYREERQRLLEETQRQAEELQAQQEELRVSNEELEQQSRALRESQNELETQHGELERVNGRLQEYAQSLEHQKRQLLATQSELEAHARALAAASQYKSEFLANMSHELRTPLNSSLILSRLLADNKRTNLDEEQVRWAHAIHDANNDLLALINDILDLAKIESGHADLRAETVRLPELCERLRTLFEPQAEQKGLAFAVEIDPAAPAQIDSDGQRLAQVLRNLLANAVKFTAQGRVTLALRPGAAGGARFEVVDTGPGIAKDKQRIIFEAFRQADGSTSRQFGGTGLGLSISRELVQRMGGTIDLESAPGQGSRFGVELPAQMPAAAPPAEVPRPVAGVPPVVAGAAPAASQTAASATAPSAPPAASAAASSADVPIAAPSSPSPAAPAPRPDPGRRVLLAVEDDSAFAEVLRELVQAQGFDCVVAGSGERALELAAEIVPSAVLLDVGLPDISGLSVLERLKRDPATRHVPVHVVSAVERSQSALELGAVGHLVKPATREALEEAIAGLKQRLEHTLRRLLVVEDDAELRANLELLLAAPGVEIVSVGTMADALAALAAASFDCMVTDLALPDGSGFDLLERMAGSEASAFPPVIVYTGRALDRDEETRLRRYSRSIIVKGARSPERLLDEVTLFLHSVESALPSEQRRLLKAARERDAVLEGRRVLLAEDDVRNIFALTSVFEPLGVTLEIARNGREAVERLGREPPVDLVLMDIMMPEMDGLTAMRRIRAELGRAELPIIALTAKAMADDRAQCLAAGANDYVAKPIDVDRLVSLCRVWMPK